MDINIGNVNGLPGPERKMLGDLIAIFNYHNGKNAEKVRKSPTCLTGHWTC